MTKEKILRFAKKNIYDCVKYLGKWKDFDVWEPGFSDSEPRYLGFPQFILVSGGSIQWNKDDEDSRAIMDALWKS